MAPSLALSRQAVDPSFPTAEAEGRARAMASWLVGPLVFRHRNGAWNEADNWTLVAVRVWWSWGLVLPCYDGCDCYLVAGTQFEVRNRVPPLKTVRLEPGKHVTSYASHLQQCRMEHAIPSVGLVAAASCTEQFHLRIRFHP